MQLERWKQIEALFQAAVVLAASERVAYLTQACQGDETLRREVEALLAADQGATEDTLAMPGQIAAEMFAKEQYLQTGQFINHYRIVSPLGAGGMGVVYLAEDTRLKRKVALKVLPAQFMQQSERIRRFEQEAQAASALNHPNILTIYEIGTVGATHFITTEFIEGQTLRARLQDNDDPLSTKLNLALQIASALVAAHEAGIIHRDIKPENVMVRPDGLVKVLDFGLAKLTEQHAKDPTAPHLTTDSGMVMGTASYMSPEQARGEKVDARTDIFSFGIMLYEMIAGRMPFAGSTVYETIAAILSQEPPPLSEAPNELQDIVTKALQKERTQRYQTIKEMQTELENLRDKVKLEAKLRSGPKVIAPTIHSPVEDTQQINAQATHSSGAIILGEIKRHKRAVYVFLLVLVAAATGLGLYWRTQLTEAPIDSIAVLPFANQNNDPQTEYLADGIPESLINSLSQLPHLKVMSRNSAFRFKEREADAQEVGRKLGVRAVLTGRIAQRGDNLIISLDLVDARDNRQIWGQQYNRRLADVFAVQEEIAHAISEKLRLKLTGNEQQQLIKRPTENLKAYQHYLQGLSYAHRRTREDLLTAIRYYDKAIEEDRNYALAYVGLAEAYGVLGARGYILPGEGRRKMEEAAHKAITLDNNLAEAHAALGQTYFQFAPYNLPLAERESRHAIELSPNSALGHQNLSYSLVRQGRLDECLEAMLKARELDPLSSTVARSIAIIHYFKRDDRQALEFLRQANELGPAFSSLSEVGIYIQNRLFDEALTELERAKRERKNDPILIFSTGMVYAAQGKRAEALQIIKELEELSGASLSQAQWIARIYAALNEKELALTWLERGLAADAIGTLLKADPVWDALRNDPRFGDLLQRMGIPM
jgi:eukaryotic-like serine/threonine-protein kinase